MNENNKQQEIVDALMTVITEFEEKPIADREANDTVIEILSRRIETINYGDGNGKTKSG